MCQKTPQTPQPDQCDCYECVEARRGGVRADRQEPDRQDACCQPPQENPDVLGMWREAFHEAYHDVQLDIFKSKIKARLSKSMEKTAELVLETMIAEIHENTRRTRFNKDLQSKLEKLIESAGDA